MSSYQTTHTGFQWVGDLRGEPDPEPEPAPPERPAWTPQSKQDCQGCGGHVTPQFRRSMGDDDDVAHACHECVEPNDLLNGAAADPDYEKRVQIPVHTIGGGER